MNDEHVVPERLTRRGFARMVIERARAAGYRDRLEYDAERDAIRQEGSWLLLAGALEAYVARDERERAALVDRLVGECLRAHVRPETVEEAREDLVPVLVRLARLEADAACGGGIPYRSLTEHLAVAVGWRSGETVTTLDEDALGAWRVRFDEALSLAMEADRLDAAGEWRTHAAVPGVLYSPWADGCDASRLLQPRALDRLRLRGDPVAVAPTPTLLLVAGAEDVAGLRSLGMAGRLGHMANPGLRQFLRPIRRRAGRWETWLPEEGHPARATLLRLALTEDERDYEEQEPRIRRLPPAGAGPAAGRMLVPAPFLAASHESGRIRTSTVWTDAGPHALPCVDLVGFRRGGVDLGWAEFEAVREVLGDGLRPMDVHPARWRADAFPTEAQFGALGLTQGGGADDPPEVG